MKHSPKKFSIFLLTINIFVFTHLADLIGSEVAGAVKNAIAVISSACTGLGLGENARAAVITRGIVEIVRVVEIMGGKMETAYDQYSIRDYFPRFACGRGLTEIIIT